MRKTVSIVSPSAQKCIDNFPPPLLLGVPRDSGLVARKTGCPLSPNLNIINSATLSHCLCGLSLQVEYHFVSDPGARNDQRPGGNLFCEYRHKCGVSNTFPFIVRRSPYDVIEHRHEDNSSLELCWVAHFVHEFLDFVDELQCGESCTRVPLAHHQLCPKFCIVVNSTVTRDNCFHGEYSQLI